MIVKLSIYTEFPIKNNIEIKIQKYTAQYVQ